MSSPVKIQFKELIKIDRRKTEPIYLQIVYQFINAVQRSYLTEGTQLYGTRVISKSLKVHRKTIVAAFDELQAQGWIEIHANIGAFVRNPQKKKTQSSENKYQPENILENTAFDFQKSFILNSPFEKSPSKLQFNDGQPDYRLCNINELSRFFSNSLKRKKVVQQFGNFYHRGNQFFKEQLSFYLNISRGFHISKDNISVVKSKEMLIYVLSQLLIKSGDTVLVGSFGYFFANMIFRQAGAKIKSIPVDDDGININFIEQNFKKNEIRCIYINAKNHYPSTETLSAAKRSALIRLSEQLNFVIIEEDEDYEFHYEQSIPLPMMSNNNGKVIYIGSFARFLIPSFQRTFLVAPKDLCFEVDKYLGIIDTQGDIVTEQALGEMIKEGDMHRYLRKSLTVYEKKRTLFAALLSQHFEDKIQFQIPNGGLAFWVQFKHAFSLTQLAQKSVENDLFIPRICLYQHTKITALRLGFGHFTEDEFTTTLTTLKRAYNLSSRIQTLSKQL